MENTNTHILTLLQTSFLFCGISPTQLEDLAQKTKLLSYHPGQVLIEEDLISNRIILILDGLVKVYKLTPDGKEIFLAFEKTNNYLGVMDLSDKPGSATVEALHPTKALVFHKKDFAALLEKNPELWEKMYRIILAKLKELNHLYSIRLGNDVKKRTYLLLRFLAQLSENDTVILSQETIAGIVGATRPRVTEALHKLRMAKKISISPKKITVL